MIDATDCLEVSVMYTTALAASLMTVMSAEQKAQAAAAIDEHIRDIESQESSEIGISPAHSQVRDLLSTFRTRLTG